jgi:LysM domain
MISNIYSIESRQGSMTDARTGYQEFEHAFEVVVTNVNAEREGAHMSAQLAPQPHAGANAGIRLTRRGRLVLIGLPLIVAAAALLTLIGFFTAPALASPGVVGPGPTVSVAVAPGQTLWDVAVLAAPDRHPHEVIAEIQQLNNLPDSVIRAGQRLHVPLGG